MENFLQVRLLPFDDDLNIASVACAAKQSEILSAKSEASAREKYAAWKTLENAASEIFSVSPEQISFSRTEYGKWCAEGFFFSLSHTSNFVAVALSNLPVGVDCESRCAFEKKASNGRLNAAKLLDRILTQEEKKSGSFSPERLLEVWTKKEAAFKYAGKGAYSPKELPIASFADKTATFECGDVVCAVCSDAVELLQVRLATQKDL